MIISKDAREYKKTICSSFFMYGRPVLKGRLEVHIQAFPPDKRRRDLDNVLKVCIDSLQQAGLFEDDSQIDYLLIERKEVVQDGQLKVDIKEKGVSYEFY